MNQVQELESRRREILVQIAAVGPMRRGTVTQQYVETTRKDGTKVKRGPYPVHTYKEGGKTVSKRLHSQEEVEAYSAQIAAYRRYQQLHAELVRISEQLCDATAALEQTQKKTSAPKSKSK